MGRKGARRSHGSGGIRRSNHQKESPAGNHKQPATDVDDPHASAEQSIACQCALDDKEHKSAERDFWKRQLRTAYWLNVITAVAGTVALTGIVFIAAQWIAMRGQQDIVKEQLGVTLIQLRAYMAIDSFNIIASAPKPESPPDVLSGVEAQPTFKNFGGTPARNITAWNCAKILSPSEAAAFEFRHQDCPPKLASANMDQTVGPGGVVEGKRFDFGMDDLRQLNTGKNIYILGCDGIPGQLSKNACSSLSILSTTSCHGSWSYTRLPIQAAV